MKQRKTASIGLVVTGGTPSKARWRDISHEEYREYRFPGGEFTRVEKPKQIAILPYGHRIQDDQGRKYDIPFGWYTLQRENRQAEQESKPSDEGVS